jgi:hypothetical protein
MSATTITPDAPVESTRAKVLPALIGGGSAVAVLAALAIALLPASEADKARTDGEQLGEAVSAVYAAESPSEVNAALADVHREALDAREHAGDAVADQVNAQADALDRAADGFVGMYASDNEFDAELYQYELEVAADDLADNAEEFRTTGPEVQQAFWDGFESTLDKG